MSCTGIGRQLLDKFLGKASVFLPRYCADRPHAAAWTSLTYDAMAEEYEAIVDMRNMGFLHVQRQFELTFEEISASFPPSFPLRLASFYDHHKPLTLPAC